MIQLKRIRTAADIHSDFTGPKLVAKLMLLAGGRVAAGDDLVFDGQLGDWKKLKESLRRHSHACQICNQSYKGDDFPIFGKKLKAPSLPRRLPVTLVAQNRLAAKIAPDPLQVDDATLARLWLTEKPGLPHPYLEDPEQLFAWSVVETNGEVHLVEPTNASERSKIAVKAVVDHLGLNRETLLKLRYCVYQNLTLALLAWKAGDGTMRLAGEEQLTRLC